MRPNIPTPEGLHNMPNKTKADLENEIRLLKSDLDNKSRTIQNADREIDEQAKKFGDFANAIADLLAAARNANANPEQKILIDRIENDFLGLTDDYEVEVSNAYSVTVSVKFRGDRKPGTEEVKGWLYEVWNMNPPCIASDLENDGSPTVYDVKITEIDRSEIGQES